MTRDKIALDATVNSLSDEVVKVKDKKAAVKEVAVATTTGGKRVMIKRGPGFRGFVICYDSGGELPLELQGLWIKFKDALDAIAGYAAKPSSPIENVTTAISNKTVPGLK